MSMDTALIRQRFCAASANYDAEAQAQQHIAARLWALTAPHLAAGADVLEIGAGTGLLTRLILNAQPRSLTLNDLYISPQLEALKTCRVSESQFTTAPPSSTSTTLPCLLLMLGH